MSIWVIDCLQQMYHFVFNWNLNTDTLDIIPSPIHVMKSNNLIKIIWIDQEQANI